MCPLPDSEIETRKLLKSEPSGKSDDETDGEKERHIPSHNTELTTSSKSPRSMLNPSKRKQPISHTSHAPCRKLRYPCKTRHGMSAAADTAWHKRGFDSLTSHTFFMSKAKYGSSLWCVIEFAALATGGGEIDPQCQFASTDVFGIMLEVRN